MHKTNESVGKIEKISINENVLKGKLSNANLELSCYAQNIFSVFLHPQLSTAGLSYAVIQNPIQFPNYEEEDNRILIKTNKLILEIDKNNCRFTFKTLDELVINEDDTSFGTSWIGDEITTYKKLQEGERFIGLGEKTGPFDKRGSAYVNWNSDVFAYGIDADPLYTTLPFYIGLHKGLYYGIFFDNTYKSHFNFGASNNRFASFGAEGGAMKYYFIYGESIAEIVQSFSFLTGKMQLPPKWSLGLQQCRYSYYPDTDLFRIAQTYREKQIPCDVMYYDIHYMDAYKVFTWHPEYFPNPKQLNEQLEKLNFKTVVIVDPGIKVEKGYKPYDEGIEHDYFVNYPDGEPFEAQVWPGWCHFPDFTKPATRDWWASKFKQLHNDGIDGFWNDMNEPASWGQSNPNLIEFDFDGERASHKGAHNIYGSQMAKATFEGAKNSKPDERPFILTRAAYAGVQRYSVLWTGDNTASDDHLLLGNRMVSNIGLCGIPFTGNDVGGFAGETSPELFARWIQSAAFHPFFRIHKMVNTRPNEPWSYGEKVETIAKNFIGLRYRMMPYLYSLFYEASETGMPICRSLVFNYPNDEAIYQSDFENQFMLGEAILVCPVKSDTQIAKVYLPKGDWYLLYNDQYFKGGQIHFVDCPIDIIPVFVKGGQLFVEQSLTQYWNDEHAGVLSIHLYKGANESDFMFYEDDGISYQYKNNNYALRKIVFNGKNQLTLTAQEGNYRSSYQKIKLYLHGFELDKNTIPYRFIEPLPAFDPLFTPKGFVYEVEKVVVLEKDFDAEQFEINW